MQSDEKTGADQVALQQSGGIRWGRIILALAAGLLLTTAGAVTWLLNDTNRVKNFVTHLVSDLTDRPFRINGDFDFSLGSEISIAATDIQWDNAAWSSQPTMLTADALQLSVNLRSLFSPPILISNAVARNARLDFEWSPDNVSNWYLARPDSTPEPDTSHPLALLLEKADLQNIALYIRHPELTDELLITIDKAQQQQDESHHLVVDIDAEFDGRKVAIDGRVGPFPELINAGKVDFDLTAAGPNAQLKLRGGIGELASFTEPNLEAEMTAPEVAIVLDLLNLPEITHGPMQLQGKLESDGPRVYSFIKGHIGEFVVDYDISAASLKPLKGLALKVDTHGPSARVVAAIIGVKNFPREPYEFKADVQETAQGLQLNSLTFATAGATANAKGLLPNYPDLPGIKLDMQLDIENIARFGEMLPGTSVPDLAGQVTAYIRSDSASNVDQVDARFSLGSMKGHISGALTEESRFAGSTLQFDAMLPDTMRLQQVFALPVQRSEQISVSGSATVIEKGLRINAAQGSVGADSFKVSGDLVAADDGPRANLDASAAGPDLANTAGLFVVTEALPAVPYTIDTKLDFNRGELGLAPLTGKIGNDEIKLSGKLAFDGETPAIFLTINTSGADLSELPAQMGITGLPKERYTLAGNFSMSDTGIELSRIALKTPDDNIRGSLYSGWPHKPEELRFDLQASGANLRDILPTIPGYVPAAVTYQVTTQGTLYDKLLAVKNLKATVGSTTIKLNGTVDLPPDMKATGIKLKVSGSHLPDLGEIANRRFSAIPFDMSATMTGTTDSAQINDLNIVLGPNDLQGVLKFESGEKPSFDIRLTSKFLDTTKVLGIIGEDDTETGEALSNTASTRKPAKDSRLIPDIAIPAKLLNSADGSINLQIAKLEARKTQLEAFVLEGSLQNGAVNISRFNANTQKGSLDASLSLNPRADTHDLEVSATATNMVLAFGELDDMLRKNHPGQDINMYMTATGNDLRSIAASLNGYLWLRGGERQIKATELNLLFGDFLSQVFSAINPFAKKDPYQTMECNRFFFEATDGKLKTAPAILLRTDKLNIAAAGDINLHNEKMNISIETTPRTGIGIGAGDLLNPFISIQGTLSSPRLMLDPSSALIEGSAAVATAGLSIVAKSIYKRWLGPRQPCEKLTEEARKIRVKRDPEHVPAD